MSILNMTDASGGDTGGGEDGSGARGPRAVAVADGGSAVRAIVSAEASAPKAPPEGKQKKAPF